MRRYLPFVIILTVALVTVGTGALLYRAKMHVAPASKAGGGVTQGSNSQPEIPEANSTHTRGPADAPVTLEIYGDFQCPSCARISGIIGGLEQDNGSRLRVIFREFPLAMHPHAAEAAMAAEAAGLQGRFWEMHDMLYQYQEVWSKASLVRPFFEHYAESIGLDVQRFRMDSKSEELRMQIIAEGGEGEARGVKNTPTLFINNMMFRGEFSQATIQAAINTVLAGNKKS